MLSSGALRGVRALGTKRSDERHDQCWTLARRGLEHARDGEPETADAAFGANRRAVRRKRARRSRKLNGAAKLAWRRQRSVPVRSSPRTCFGSTPPGVQFRDSLEALLDQRRGNDKDRTTAKRRSRSVTLGVEFSGRNGRQRNPQAPPGTIRCLLHPRRGLRECRGSALRKDRVDTRVFAGWCCQFNQGRPILESADRC